MLRLVALFCCLSAALVCHGQRSQDWLPITAQERGMKDAPGDPGAAAVQLYYADHRDDVQKYRFIYRRIKVLNDKGKEYGNVVVPVPAGYSMTAIQGRTIRPDGAVVEFNGKTFERVLVSGREGKIVARAWTMPQVGVGSIVEYKYRLTWEADVYDAIWSLQHSLYTVKESFWLLPYRGQLRTRFFADETRLSFVYSNLPPGVTPKDTGGGIELTVEGIPAFKTESFMPPEDNFKPEVRFFYGGREIESPEVFWKAIGKDWYVQVEHFMGSHQEVRKAAAEIIGDETDPQKSLRKLYARVQLVRNLSYESPEALARLKRAGLKSSENVLDVLRHGYGSQNEIAELLAALARASGFEAGVVRASSRETRVFDVKMLSEQQLQWELVRVTLNGSEIFLDPGTRFAPFGLVFWAHTSAPALQLAQDGGEFVVAPTPTADKTVTRRVARLNLFPDGSLRGDLTLEFKGNDALQRRLNALSNDAQGREQLEQDLLGWLPAGSVVQFKDAQGWNSSEDPLVAHFQVEIPHYAARAGQRLLVPANLFHSRLTDAFRDEERRYPVYFPYTFEEIDSLTMALPDGYSVETLPNGQDEKLPSARFLTTRSASGRELTQTRALVVNSIYYTPEQYPAIRAFFSKLRTADEERTVVEAAAAGAIHP